MSKYDIKKTPQLPSDEEINKHKNFDKVLKKAAMYDYKKATKPIYKNTKVLSIVAVIIAVGLIILFEVNEESDDDTIEHKTEEIDSSQINKNSPLIDTVTKATEPISSTAPTSATTQRTNATEASTQQQPAQTAESSTTTIPIALTNATAHFLGGEDALKTFLLTNIKYPYNAVETPYSGKIEVDLQIEKNGEIGNFTIYHSPNAAISNEIKRVIKKMPKWNAAVKNNQAIASTVSVYFPFTYIGE